MDCLPGADGVQGAVNRVAGFPGRERNLHGLAVADFADQDDLGGLSQGGAQAVGKGVEVAPQFALAERGLEMRMQKFNRVFQRDDMGLVGLVDFVQHGRQRGGLAAAGGAGHKNEAVLFLDDLPEHRRQMKRFQGGNLRLEPAKHHRVIAVLAEDVDAETAKILQGITAIARTVVRQVLESAGDCY